MRVYGGATLGANTFTGAQTLPAGTVGAPALNFGDAASGFYRPGSNMVAVSINNDGVASFISTGLQFRAGVGFRWSNGAIGGTTDLAITRVATGVMSLSDTTNGVSLNVTGNSLAVRNLANGADAPITASSGTFTGLVLTPASATGSAGLRAPHGAAPTSPTNGDIWTTTAGLFVQINGSTVGPLS